MKFLLSLLLLFLFSSCATTSPSAQQCTMPGNEVATLLALPYQEFDQSPGKGWRPIGEKGCYELAGSLLDCYSDRHRSTLHPSEVRILMWHAGQMYAFENDYTLAIERFQLSHNPEQPSDAPLLWNDYVGATLAFLGKDFEKLRLHRKRIANGPVWNGRRANLDVVDGLIQCFDKPYAVAYSNCR